MRSAATLTLICLLAGTVETEAASPAGAAQAVQAAEDRERRLRRDPDRLRFRHHILGLVRSWKRARSAARDTRLEPKAAEGVVRSLELLAHWSGRKEDAARARQARQQWRRSHGVPPPHLKAERNGVASSPELRARARVQDEPSRAEPRASAIPTPLPVPDPTRPRRATPASLGRPLDPLRIRTVVIDPGHGGTEHGARSARGLLEKHVNLAIARALKAELESDFHVLLTRERDRTLSLAERVRMANRAEADLFVSIHANGHSQSRFHGIETYVLATDSPRYPRRLERREHHHHAIEIAEDPHLRQDVRLLLADLAMRSAADQGRQLAERVQAHVVQGLRSQHPEVVDLGVKEALFFVLLGPRMPSVLVETGFLTHPEEAQRLARPGYRRRVAAGIARGIRSYAGQRAQQARSEPRSATDAYVALP